MREIDRAPDMELQVVATGSHLSPEFGLTVDEVIADGFEVDARVESLLSSDTPVGIAKSVGLGVIGMADGATGLSWDEGSTTFADNGPAEMTDKLPEVMAAVEDYRAQILDGSLEVCNALVETEACAPLK